MRTLCIAAISIASRFAPAAAVAQDSLPPAEVVRQIQASGTTSPVMRHLLFDGCPQNDERGRRVFEAIASANLPISATAELSARWSREYGECNYPPLETFFEDALDDVLSSSDASAVLLFVSRLPPDISPRMRESLWRATSTYETEPAVVELVANHAVGSTNPTELASLTVEAIRSRQVSTDWILSHAAFLLMEHRALYLPVLARASVTMADDRLRLVLGSLYSHVSAGKLSARAPELEALRNNVRNRDAIPAHLRALEPQGAAR